MNTEEAKFLLQAYRPDGRDAQDPQFAGALEQLKHDPALEKWFYEQQAFDEAVAGKVRSLAVPASLKSEILAGRKTVQVAAWRRWQPAWVALAACLMVLLGLAGVFFKSMRHPSFADYRGDMVSYIQNLEQGRETLQLKSGDVGEIRNWLGKHSVYKSLELPTRLTAGSGVGCRVIDWNGQSVALACFRLEGGAVAHVLVIDRSGLRDTPEIGTRYLALLNGMNTAAWSSETKTYLMVSRAPEEALERLL